MTEGKAEFVRKMRNLIKAIIWIWAIGSFVVFWVFEKMASQVRNPVGTQTIKEATRMDWSQILIPWLLFGIAPAIVLGLILYLMPGGRRKVRGGPQGQ